MTDTVQPGVSKGPKVFISYNRADREWAEWIASVLEETGFTPFLQAWHILPGMNFGVEMHKAASEADITIAVLSEAFLKSEFTLPEWVAAFVSDPTGGNRKLIPVRVAKCEPSGLLKAVVYIDLIGLEESAATKSLIDGLKPTGRPVGAISFPGQINAQTTSVVPFPPSLGKLHFVPELPPHFLPRANALDTMKARLLVNDAAPLGIMGRGELVGVGGMGGIGKSVLAAALAYEPDIRLAFPDGVIWLAVGQQPNMVELQSRLLRVLTGAIPDATIHELADAVRDALENRRILLILDDVWELDHAALFRGIPNSCRLLLTTRNTEVLTGLNAMEYQVDLLTLEESLSLLANWSGLEREILPQEAHQIVQECGQLPLALAAIGAMVRVGATAWLDALTRLRRADLDKVKKSFPDYPYPHLLRALEISIEALIPEDRERYQDLAVFPEEAAIPEGPLALMWKLDDLDTRDTMRRLAARSLATLRETPGEGLRLILHDLQRDVVRKHRESILPSLHAKLIEAYGDVCETRRANSEVQIASKWSFGPDDGYYFERLPWHIKGSGTEPNLRFLLLDLDWLQGKLKVTNIVALIADYDLLANDVELRLVQSAIRLSADTLRRDPNQLVSQLQGRLHWMEPQITRLEDQWNEASPPWLRILTPTLSAPREALVEIFNEKHLPVKTRVLAVTTTGTVVSGGQEGIRVWDLATGAERFVYSSIEKHPNLDRHLNASKAIVLTPDHNRAIVYFDRGPVRIWNLATGEVERSFDGLESPLSVAITSDGRYLIEGFRYHLRVWNLAQNVMQYYVNRPAQVVAISAAGTCHIASEKTVLMWDIEAGIARGEFICRGYITALTVTPDGNTVIAGGDWDGLPEICSYDAKSGKLLREFRGHTKASESSAWINALAITPDGTTLLSAARDETVRVWNVKTGEMQTTFEHPGAAIALAILPDGHSAISAGYDDKVRIWDLSEHQSRVRTPQHTGKILAVAFSPDGKWLLSGGDDCMVRLWDTTSWEVVGAFEGHTRRIHAIAISPDNTRAITAGLDHSIRIWEIPSGRLEHTFEEGHSYCVRGVAVTPDGHHVISGAEDSMICVWDLDRKERSGRFGSDSGEVQAVILTPDGEQVVFCDQGGWVHTMLLSNGEHLLEMGHRSEPVQSVAITPDGTRAVWGTLKGTIEVWSLHTGQQVQTWSGLAPVLSVAVTADSRLITGHTDGTILVADLNTGKSIASFTGDSHNMITSVSPDGSTIVAGDTSGRLHVLRLA